MKKLLLVYNPHAGKGKARQKLSDLLDEFCRAGWLATVYPTQGQGDAARIIRSLGSRYERVVCCGGDGTLHEGVAALMELSCPPVLGYIPAGTTNDVSRSLDLPANMARAARVAVGEDLFPCDMGRFNGAPFVYVAAFGAFTDVSYDTPQEFKNLFGHLAYVLTGIGRLGAIRGLHMKVEHDGGRLEDDFLFGMVSNTKSVGGFQMDPDDVVELDDGLFEVVLVRQPRDAEERQALMTTLMTGEMVEDTPFITLRSASLRVESPEAVAWTLDGEFGGAHTAVTVTNCHRAVTLACRPKGKR